MIASHGAGKLCVAFILLPARRCWLAQQPRHTKHTHTQKLWMNLWHFGCIWRTMRPTCMYRYVTGCFDYACTIEKSPAGIVMDFWMKAGEQHAYALRMAAGTISDSMHIFTFFFSFKWLWKPFRNCFICQMVRSFRAILYSIIILLLDHCSDSDITLGIGYRSLFFSSFLFCGCSPLTVAAEVYLYVCFMVWYEIQKICCALRECDWRVQIINIDTQHCCGSIVMFSMHLS